jgi:hypothetical protein
VLGWFGPRARPPAGLRLPQVLIATDVAAEGLDLQRASRVIHFDLPWTDVRLRQRAGRARRIGAGTAVVEVVTMPPAPPLERRLRQLERIVRKRELAGTAGLDLADPWLFRWRADIARWADGTGTGYGHAIVAGSESGWLAGLALAPVGESPAPANLLWFGDDGSFSDQPGEVAPRLLLSATAPAGSGDLEWDRLQPRLLAVTRSILASTAGAAWCPGPAGQLRKVLVRRLRAMARGASVSRDLDRIGKIERALTVVGGGLTSGEEILAERSASLPDGDLLQALSRLPLRAPPLPPALPVLTGIVRVASFSPCARSTPFCSTSMAPSSTPSS